ncbi:conserved hypothetical protein [Candidatus Desulfarcum epimagneticum]|uniref:DUF3795 domain-containing protein n=1 Tax=uncultured Desulfobacteraceae bacterium TaxID=218296 RepID=A0A484HGS0_9BACT|nr:conserved hypothetical protein [uncultured Desulfobacteraceae bacterium]
MKINPDFVSPCGLYCGVCAIYMAHQDDNQKFKELLVGVYRGEAPGKGALPGAETLSADDIRCRGCLSDERFMHCRQCEIRDCAMEKGHAGCWECGDFPCGHIENFPMTVGKKVILRCVPHCREVGVEKWIEDEEARYVCPECGSKLFRGAGRCNACKTPVDPD